MSSDKIYKGHLYEELEKDYRIKEGLKACMNCGVCTAERFGVEFRMGSIVEVDTTSRPFRVKSETGDELLADTIVVATGASARWLGVKGEDQFKGGGVSACATCDGFFEAIGNTPNTAIFRDKLEMDEAGYIITKPKSTATSVPGIFAAGDCQDRLFRQAIIAAGSGATAGMEVERFLMENA